MKNRQVTKEKMSGIQEQEKRFLDDLANAIIILSESLAKKEFSGKIRSNGNDE
jgi:hypothetical protein